MGARCGASPARTQGRLSEGTNTSVARYLGDWISAAGACSILLERRIQAMRPFENDCCLLQVILHAHRLLRLMWSVPLLAGPLETKESFFQEQCRHLRIGNLRVQQKSVVHQFCLNMMNWLGALLAEQGGVLSVVLNGMQVRCSHWRDAKTPGHPFFDIAGFLGLHGMDDRHLHHFVIFVCAVGTMFLGSKKSLLTSLCHSSLSCMLLNTHLCHGTERKELSLPRERQLSVALW